MGDNRIELWGRLAQHPDLRSTPSGTPLLRLWVACGAASEELELEVVMPGEQGRQLAAGLRAGQQVWAAGRLRTLSSSSRSGLREQRLEVVASAIEPRAEAPAWAKPEVEAKGWRAKR